MNKVIHRIWIGKPVIKKDYTEFVKTVNDCFDDYVPVFWTDYNSKQFVKEYFPEWEKFLFKSKTNPAMVSDVFRYLVLRKYGGVYSDFDVELINPKNLKGVVEENSFTAITELKISKQFSEMTKTIPIRNGIAEDINRVANYFMCCEANHEVWYIIFDEMRRRMERIPKMEEDYDVLYITGPDLISTVVNRYKKKLGLNVLSLKDSSCVKHHCYGEHTWKKMLKPNSVGWHGKETSY